jgi:hypothetical protein
MSQYDSQLSVLATTSAGIYEDPQRLAAKLRRFAQLPAGWNHARGIPVSAQAIRLAERLVAVVCALGLKADVFPSDDGGCVVAAYRGEERVEISVNADGTQFGLRAERGLGFNYEDVIEPIENASVEDISRQILRLVREVEWNLLVSSTYATSTVRADVSSISHFGTRPSHLIQRPLQTVEGGSQSSRPLVPALP